MDAFRARQWRRRRGGIVERGVEDATLVLLLGVEEMVEDLCEGNEGMEGMLRGMWEARMGTVKMCEEADEGVVEKSTEESLRGM